MGNILSNKEFYNQLASDYDSMISFSSALRQKSKVLKKIILPLMKYAADVGCGTGIDSIALAKLGLSVTAFDPSGDMIKAAGNNAAREGVSINFQNYAADEIPDRFNNSFDIVISLGNTFANIEREKFIQSVRKCYEILKPKGSLLIQVLNYKKILSERERIVNITEKDGNYFIRFYDFNNDDINFNILKFNKSKPTGFLFITTKIFPYLKKDFELSLTRAGFNIIENYSGFDLEVFDETSSKDLLIRAIKS